MASDNDIKVSSLVPGTAYQFRIYAVTQSGRGAAVALVQQTQPSQGTIKNLTYTLIIN